MVEYFDLYVQTYRKVIERYFHPFREYLSFYVNYPYLTTLVRSGPSGVMCFRKPAEVAQTNVMLWSQLPPGLSTFFDIRDHFDAPFATFDFRPRSYRPTDAEIEATRAALNHALELFWDVIEQEKFTSVCQALIQAEGIEITTDDSVDGVGFNAVGRLVLAEFGGFRREERWAFRFHHHKSSRVSAQVIRDAENEVQNSDYDVLCLLTSGDLTSIGNYVSVTSEKVRIWDDAVLNYLVNRHVSVIEPEFGGYAEALARLDEEFRLRGGADYDRVKEQLESCPTGQRHFAAYEEIGTEILRDLFAHTLGPARPQPSSHDGVHRRDVLFRNTQGSAFFRRIADRYRSDFLVVDFKNYGRALPGATLESAAKYANKALGMFILIVSRRGAAQGSRSAQIRLFRDEGIVVLSISDDHLLEMVARKERGEQPEDVLEDLLDELLIAY